MSEKKVLFSIEVVTDCDTGLYQVGELDFSIHHELKQYIETYGAEGLARLHRMLCFFICRTRDIFHEKHSLVFAQEQKINKLNL